MLFSTFAEFGATLKKETKESIFSLVGDFDTNADCDVYYVTAATLGETDGHLSSALGEWENYPIFQGSIVTQEFIPETGKTTLYLYVVLKVA